MEASVQATTVLGILVLPLLPRFDGGCSVAIEELWRLLYRRWLMPRQPGVGLLWSGSAEGVWRLRLLL